MAQIKNSLIPCKFNNYYNRLLKIETDYTQYEAVRTGTKNIENYNFNPNDGITAEVVINQADEEITKADYLVVLKETIENNISTKKIDSRWFILECKRNRLCQYTLSLYRDSLADNFNALIDAPLFVEKSGRLNINDPAIFNNEDMSFNQIKTSETLLKDETKCAWVVGYIPRDFKNDGFSIDYPLTGSQDYTVEKLSDWKYYNYLGTNKGSLHKAIYGVYVKADGIMASAGIYSDGSLYEFSGLDYYTFDAKIGNIETPTVINNGLTFTATSFSSSSINRYRKEVFNGVLVNQLNATLSQEQGLSTDLNAYVIAELNGKIILDKSSNTYYRITVATTYRQEVTDFSNIDINRNITGLEILGTAQTGNFKVQFEYNEITIKLEQAYQKAYLTIPENRYHLNDQPYDMFCIPYSDDLEIYKKGILQLKADKNLSLAVGSVIGAMVGSAGIYDVQLLPYCPVRYCIGEDGKFDFKDAIVTNIVRDSQSVKAIGYLFWANKSTFSFNINQSLKIKYPRLKTKRKSKAKSIGTDGTFIIDLSPYIGEDELFKFTPVTATPYGYKSYEFDGAHKIATFYFDQQYAKKSEVIVFDLTFIEPVQLTANDVKISNECDMYRLCSPNYNGQFEFSLAKNGEIKYFNVDCSYRPFNPYIHVNPNFNKLYGKDFNDARGLVCGGDFSLTQITSAWANYELNNKNYQKIFDRNIQNLEVTQDVERQQQIVGTIASALGAGISTGTTIGSISSGPIGAAVGLGTSAVSLTAGMVDYQLSEKLRNEAIDYRVDQFGYQLGNIKALPYGLSKISSLNENNKIFPFIEYYTCTDEEKEALKNKIAYNGASIGRIGTIREYLYQSKFENKTGFWYIKGKMIRLLNFGGDYQQLNVIASEMLKGIFISNEIVGE
nr:MAG TPA: hypothetical protein [Caudoviricetes sp.]